jgi:hypothetical protein
MLAVGIGIFTVAMFSLASLIAGLSWCMAHTDWQPRLRIVAWFAIGLGGLPGLVVFDFFIIGFPISLGLFWLAFGSARYRLFAYGLPAICCLGMTILLATSDDSPDWFFLALTTCCAVQTIMKLGRSFGRGTLWAEYFERRASPMPAVRR